MNFPKLHDKILKAEKNLEKQTREMTRTKYEILDSYYLLGKALEDKSVELKSKNPLRSAKIMLNNEIRRQFPSDTARNIFNKRKRSALNTYRIFSTEGIGRDKIQRIRSFTLHPSAIRKFTDNEIKIVKERDTNTHTCDHEEEINRRVKKEVDVLCQLLLEYNENTFGKFMRGITNDHEERVKANKKLRCEVEEKKIELQEAEKILASLNHTLLIRKINRFSTFSLYVPAPLKSTI
ncbi:hypothetical protein G9A89_016633 [Geosiphon pyriformis]|nr:hypothetical protein G9A89_016633 [Geosiphon pyriformis]